MFMTCKENTLKVQSPVPKDILKCVQEMTSHRLGVSLYNM